MAKTIGTVMPKKDQKPLWPGARRTSRGNLVTLPGMWGSMEGPHRVNSCLEWSFLMDGGTRLVRLRLGPGQGDFQVLGLPGDAVQPGSNPEETLWEAGEMAGEEDDGESILLPI